MPVRLSLPEAVAAKLGPEPEWLRELREEALAAAEELPLPKLERYRLEAARFEAADPAAVPPAASVPVPKETARAGRIVLHHGTVVARELRPELADAGVRLLSFLECRSVDELLLRRHLFAGRERLADDRLFALHRAYVDAGAVVHVPRGVRLEAPLEVVVHLSADAFPHILVVVEEGAEVDVVESLVSADDVKATVNARVEVIVGDGARVRYFGLQTVGAGTRLYRPKHGFVGRDARLEWYLVEAGGLRNVAQNTSHLLGPGGFSDSTAVFLGEGRQDLFVSTAMLHWSHHTESNMETRGVLRDRAHAVYMGTTDIMKGSPGCQSWQKESTLLLSDDCRVELIPALWIENHDVSRAGHAAAAGQVDREQVYYLMSRGIPERDAVLLIVLGYLKPVIDRIPLPEVAERLSTLVEKKVRA
jgi:Fe-S cluster assembly protein SufD